MATKSRHSVFLPSLPPEVWICIFEHATYVPGTMVPEIYEHSSLIGPLYNRKYHPPLREALVTKRSLVRVCKQWWHLASQFLYQSIYIGRMRSLTPLRSTLMCSAAGIGTLTGNWPLGTYTRRLDLAIRDYSVPPGDSGILDTLPDVIDCLQSLEIVSFAISNQLILMPNGLLDALKNSAGSLRVLDWSPELRVTPTDRLFVFLAACTQLRILSFPYLRWSEELKPGNLTSTIATLRVQSLLTPSLYPPSQPDDLLDPRDTSSALRELIIDVRDNVQHWEGFLRHYGGRLTAVQLQFTEPPTFTLPLFHGYMQLLARACPVLRRITLSVIDFSFNAQQPLELPPVEYFGLRAHTFQSRRSEFQSLFSTLAKLRTTTPSLRVVQLTDPHNVNCLLRSHPKLAVRALKHELSGSPFRLEDHDGDLLEDRLKALGHM
ncbi:hypothetical protein HYDPIDRAFT_113363 [Hydnomerulius pinastri MD-312]|uniref:F-box domain-containing protein n=1 Tax=Hydnomerulius pinastri MD-312 TaxID=994086 RepID=A0A0C9VCP8_9AGAM|nr:hypothetical protein HYDPIDRAFT_113363 [Hydnomerulius pinastri MD-312]